MAIFIFVLIAASLYFRIAKFDAHNFAITFCVSVFSLLFMGIAVLKTDFLTVKSVLSITVERLQSTPLNAPHDNIFYIFAIGYEIVALFALLTFMRFVLGLTHTISLLISLSIFALLNIIALAIMTGKLQLLISTDIGVICGWLIFILLIAMVIAILGPVLATINLVVLVAIYGFQVQAIGHLAQYFQMENMVGLIGIEKIVLFLIITTVIASIDTLKSIFD